MRIQHGLFDILLADSDFDLHALFMHQVRFDDEEAVKQVRRTHRGMARSCGEQQSPEGSRQNLLCHCLSPFFRRLRTI